MFNINFPFYSIMIILALISNIIVIFKLAKKILFETEEIVCLLLYENVGIIGGAKLLSFLLSYEKLNGVFNFVKVGLTSYGAVFGALAFLILFCIQFKKSIKEVLFIFMPSLPLMYAIGKIGCFLAGCCYGIEYNGIFKVAYKYSKLMPQNKYFFPIQIVETIVFLIIFVYMMIKHKKNQFDEKALGISFIMCGIAKFTLDYLRISHNGKILSVNQIISIFFILIGIIVYKKKKAKKNNI